MSESNQNEQSRLEREEAEVREALLGDSSERTTEWLFEQLGETGAILLHERDKQS